MNRFPNDANVMIAPRLNVVLRKSINEFSNRFNDLFGERVVADYQSVNLLGREWRQVAVYYIPATFL